MPITFKNSTPEPKRGVTRIGSAPDGTARLAGGVTIIDSRGRATNQSGVRRLTERGER